MKYSVTMPSLGADMDSGKLLEWYVKPGDVLKKGDLLAAVETTKAAVDIESFRSGTILELLGEVDQVIAVGAVIATMEIADDGTAPAATSATPTTTATAPPVAHTTPIAHSGARKRISPAARHLAEKSGIDLATLHGTGHDGAIELQDVEAALANKNAGGKPTTTSGASLINVREAIARAMARSKRDIPHYYLQSRFNMDALVAWLDTQNSTQSPENRLFMPAVLMRAVVIALQANPDMNGYYNNGVFTASAEIHLGITVALKLNGVMTPAILDAHNMTLTQLNSAFSDTVQRTRSGKLRNREMTDGTVTVTNVGDLGADSVLGIIFPPQVALVGFGRVHKAPIVDGAIVRPGWVLDATLSADHRVSDGLAGSKLLNTIGRLLANPAQLES